MHMRVKRVFLLASIPLLAVLALAPLTCAEDAPAAQPGDTISWIKDLTKAFKLAVERKKPVMICINSHRVDGGKVEPAAKGLREIVYKDPRVVGKSRSFVCVFLTSEGSSNDYGELRMRFGVDGLIVSPQHIFAHPEHEVGAEPLVRKEYWPHGKGEAAVKALLGMMDKALAGYRSREGQPATPPPPAAEPAEQQPDAPAGPDGAAARSAWIEKLLGIVRTSEGPQRREALRSLVTNDKEGDCTTPLIALMSELETKKNVPALVDVVRVLGLPELVAAAEPIAAYLKHKDDDLRANAAVSLEYIGCAESIAPLMARAKREKIEIIANHMHRALGRCGAGEAKVRTFLAKKAGDAKTETSSYGAIVGLAYFEGDAKAARSVEKLLGKMGPPGGGRRGGWGRGMLKRALLAWALSEIADPKSAKFMQAKLLKPLEHAQAWWTGPVKIYYQAVADKCAGDSSVFDAIDGGIRRTLEFAGGSSPVHDEARMNRDSSRFTPKGEWEAAARQFGGGRGGRGGGGGGG